MTALISHTTIDSADAYSQSAWWADVLCILRTEAERENRL